MLITTLYGRPSLGKLVLSFEGYLVPHHGMANQSLLQRFSKLAKGFVRSTKRGREGTREILRGALNSMENLRTLTPYDFEPRLPLDSLKLLREVAPHLSLKSLRFFHSSNDFFFLSDEEKLPIACELAFFLQHQPLLLDLRLSTYRGCLKGQQIPPNVVPLLQSLNGVASDIRMIVPGRPLTSITIWEHADEPAILLWEELLASTQPITHLTLHIYPYHPIGLSLWVMAKHLTQLQSLTLVGVREYEDYEV
ncbi:hypothetical protein FRB97_002346, partial [Tulasnella sp. 331]